MSDNRGTIPYQRARFSTHLPAERRYTPSHFWVLEESAGVWRVGFTKFATRMLGEIVEYGFSVSAGEAITPGQVIGWIEGFKALSDLYGVIAGQFLGPNAMLQEDITLLDTDPYGQGWLYRASGQPQPDTVDVHGYIDLLNLTIDRAQRQPIDPGCT